MSTLIVLAEASGGTTPFVRWATEAGHRCIEICDPDLFREEYIAGEALTRETPDCVVVVAERIQEPVERLVHYLRVCHPQSGVMVVGGEQGSPQGGAVLRAGGDAQLGADTSRDRFLVTVDHLLELARTRTELSYLRRRDALGTEMGRLVGRCPAMRSVFDQMMGLCRRTVRSRAPTVLVTGETGTGKGQIARAIHYNGTRRDQALVEVNCAALKGSLMEAELFGCEKGAFTGAHSARAGLFEVAHSGTIFLDEVSAVTPDLQATLLRFLDDHSIRRLGSTTERHLDVQVIAATNRDLDAAVRMGEFREDLYYRLSVIRIHLPPLRERGRDVVDLAENFLEEVCRQYGIPTKRLSPKAEKALQRYRWPGNVRELRNRMERVVLLCDTEVIEPLHLELHVDPLRVTPTFGAVQVELPAEGIDLEQVEKALIEKAMEMSGGNVSRAARLLGLSRSALRYRLGKES